MRKQTKAEARYQDHPKGTQRCGLCANFIPPNDCRVIQGPVSDDGWSVVPALGPSGPVPGAQERFPKITWKSLDSARATFALGKGLESVWATLRLGVELEPGRVYELQLNTAHGHGFRSAPDGVPLSPYRIRFKTRGAAGLQR